AIAMPRSVRLGGRSTSDTQMGVVVTSAVELAMLVCLSERIHVAKCSASATPAAIAFAQPFAPSRASCARCVSAALKAKGTPTSVSRHAAIASGGASASRMRIAAHDTAVTAMNSPRPTRGVMRSCRLGDLEVRAGRGLEPPAALDHRAVRLELPLAARLVPAQLRRHALRHALGRPEALIARAQQ